VDQPTPTAQTADYVRIDIAALRRGVKARLHESIKGSTYAEGFNDALYIVMDMLDGLTPWDPAKERTYDY